MLNAADDATRQERQLRIGPTMTHDPLTSPADAYSPDADRAGPDAPARLPEWVVHLLAVVIHFILSRTLAAHGRRSPLPSWWQDRPDLPPISAQALAAAVRGPFGNAIAWMCLRRGFGPGHQDRPELSHAIVAFRGRTPVGTPPFAATSRHALVAHKRLIKINRDIRETRRDSRDDRIGGLRGNPAGCPAPATPTSRPLPCGPRHSPPPTPAA